MRNRGLRHREILRHDTAAMAAAGVTTGSAYGLALSHTGWLISR
jgi:hypothetical protein